MSTPGRRIRRVVTDRTGGVGRRPYDSFNLAEHVGDAPGAVTANRARLAAAAGVGPDRLVWMQPVHGARVQVVDTAQTAAVQDCDGLVTTAPGLVLTALSADCVPILLADHEAGVIGAVHAGRLGVRLGVAAQALAVMVAAGARAARVDALLGPAICGGCYEVPPAMQHDVEAHAPGSASRTSAGTTGLDLRAGIAAQLGAAGVGRIAVDARCTFEDQRLFSHRREGRTGRQAGLVWIE
ncbi:MAG: peptidoglycan editing factor PgeF [Geodermatophilaceae bacterium]